MKNLYSKPCKELLRLTGSHLIFLEDGRNKVILKVHEHPETLECFELQILNKCLVLIEIMITEKGIFTVECLPQSKEMIYLDKENFLNKNIQHMILLRILAQELISLEKESKKFWTKQCKEISKRLLFHTKTDSQDSDLNYLNTLYNKMEEKSQLLIMKNSKVVNKNCQKICLASSMYSTASKWEKGDTVTRNYKIKLYPNHEQKKVLSEWFTTTRYVYNRALHYVQQNESCSHELYYLFERYHKYNFYDMRNLFVTKKGNENFLNEWEFATPKDIRAGVIKELCTQLSTNVDKIKNKKIKKFKMKYKTKKSKSMSISIPKSAIKFNKENDINIFRTVLKSAIKIGKRTKNKNKQINLKKIEHDCKIHFNGYEYFLLVPRSRNIKQKEDKNMIIALDPGEKTFQTGFSNTSDVMKSHINGKYYKIKEKISNIQSTKCRKYKLNKLYSKMKNYVDHMHYSTINFLAKNYNDILIPDFESQKIVQKMFKKCKAVKNNLLNFSHFKFRQRLEEKSMEYSNLRIHTVQEHYTSQTCSSCGTLQKIGSKRIYHCNNCDLVLDRDVNAAKNILLKYSILL